MKESVMYKLCYYRFGEQRTDHSRNGVGYIIIYNIEIVYITYIMWYHVF